MREAGAGFRDIAEWMRDTQERKMTFMAVKCTLTCRRCSASVDMKNYATLGLGGLAKKRSYVFT
jgi:hypothetical protein